MVKFEVIFGLIALIVWGISDFIRKRASMEGIEPTSFLVIESLTVASLSIILSLAFGKGLEFNKPVLTYAPICGILATIALISLLVGLSKGEASTIVPIARLGFVLTFSIAIFTLGEQITLQKVLGIVFAVLAVILLST
jgi:transporter family protein